MYQIKTYYSADPQYDMKPMTWKKTVLGVLLLFLWLFLALSFFQNESGNFWDILGNGIGRMLSYGILVVCVVLYVFLTVWLGKNLCENRKNAVSKQKTLIRVTADKITIHYPKKSVKYEIAKDSLTDIKVRKWIAVKAEESGVRDLDGMALGLNQVFRSVTFSGCIRRNDGAQFEQFVLKFAPGEYKRIKKDYDAFHSDLVRLIFSKGFGEENKMHDWKEESFEEDS